MDALDAALDALEELGRPELAAGIQTARHLADNPRMVLWDLLFEASEVLASRGLPGVGEIGDILEKRRLLLPARSLAHCPFCGSNSDLRVIRDRSELLSWAIRCGMCGATGPGCDSEADVNEAWSERLGPE